MKKTITLALLALTLSTAAQDKADSLFTQLKNWQGKTGIVADTNLYNIYYGLGTNFQNSNPDTAIHFYNKSIVYAKKQQDELKEGKSIMNQGWCFYIKSDNEKALLYNHQALTIAEKNIKYPTKKEKAKKLQASVLVNIGNVYASQGDYSKALDYYFKALKINEEIGNKMGQAPNLGNIGNVYGSQGDYSKALDYHFKALKINEEIGNKRSQANNLCNIGLVYANQGDPSVTTSKEESIRAGYSKALDYYFKAQKIDEETGNKNGQAPNLDNIGNVYASQGDYSKALDYHFKALKINEEIGNKRSQAVNLGNIGRVYVEQKKYKEAYTYLSQAIQLGEEVGIPYQLEGFYNSQSELFTQTGKHQEAMEAYKKHIMYRDSVLSEENQKAGVQQQAKYEYEKQKAIDDAEHEKQLAIEQEAKDKQKVITYSITGGLGLVVVFLIFVFNRLQVTKKQKTIILAQKQLVEQQKEAVEEAHALLEEKNSEIIASIRYAKRIQDALMTSQKYIERNINRLKN
jgi:tetratricopeptide (TPR) repeat protein